MNPRAFIPGEAPVLVLVFVAAAYAAAGISAWLHVRRNPLAERLRAVRGEAETVVRPAPLARRAGWRIRPSELTSSAALSALAGGVLGLALLRLPGAVIGLGLGAVTPRLVASRRAARRLADFNTQLPEALGIIANALRAGYSFLQALDTVSTEMSDPLGTEFRQAVKEVRVNIAVEDALGNLLGRVGSQDLDLVVTAVLIQRQVGGNLAEVLEQIAETIRERVRLQGEVRAMTAQGRLSGLIVGLLPVGLAAFFEVVNPGYLAPMVHSVVGLGLLGLAATMQMTGALIIRRMVRLEV